MIKTILSYDAETFDELVNDFEREYFVFATQTHQTYDPRVEKMLFTAVIFHKGKRPEVKE
jgi:hypothetical protein